MSTIKIQYLRINTMIFNYNQLPNNYITKYETAETKKIGRGKKATTYGKIHVAFDIETTRMDEKSYMYIWQLQINNDTILGRTWQEFESLASQLHNLPYTILVWVANLGFEFQFLMKRFEITNLFAKEKRQPLKFNIGNLEFHDALAISGGSLEQLANDYTKTKKLVGELDYTVLRNSKTELSQSDELQYCINDVVILKEFSEFLWETYIDKGFIPITKTSILRREVRLKAKGWCCERGIKMSRLNYEVSKMFPPTAKQYNFDMEYLFCGGFTHANARYVGETLTSKNMIGIDFTSSYPSVMFNDYVPVTPFVETDFSYEKLKKYACKMIVSFYGVRAKTSHSIFSKNKILRHSKNSVFDNGRFMQGSLSLYLTELDFEIFKKFYSYRKMVIHKFETAKRGYLPKYLLDVLYLHYKTKNDLKKNGKKDTQEYAICKSMVNSAYGLTVTRLCFNDIYFNDGEWSIHPTDKQYSEMISKEILSPYFGIWITAQARHNELLTLFDMTDPQEGHDIAYSDTDSHKLTDDFFRPYIDTYNKMQILKNAKTCYRLGYDMTTLWDIGCFEYESNMTKFKTLGSKRYIYQDESGFHQTISGLGKKSMEKYCKATKKDAFEIFNDRMAIPSQFTDKLRSVYNDESHADMVLDEYMQEESSVALVPVEFTLKLTDEYINIIYKLYERTIRRIES